MNMNLYVGIQSAQWLSEPSNLKIYKVEGSESNSANCILLILGSKLRKRQLEPVLFYVAVCRLFFAILVILA